MMDQNQKAFLMLLSCSLRDVWKPNDSDIFQGVDWKAIYQTAFSHKVHTLLYPVVKSLEPNNYYIPPGLKEEWEDSVVLNTLRELMKLEEFKDTVSAFNEIGIDIVIYKGIELKDLYRYPELRTMGDIDILVNKIDVEPGSRLLVTMGYKERHREDHVLEYIHDTKKSIELHSSLVNAKRDRQFRFIDDIMWKHIRPGSYMGEKVYQFTPAFHLAFLIIHMFKHFARDGIGLRQLYDICVYASHYENEIDWARFWDILNKADIMSYTAYILAACKLYLDFSVIRESPDNLPEINENYLEQFMTELISGGVFGGNGLENPYENMLIKSMDSKKERFGENKIILFFRLLSKAVFIQPEKLGVRYAYAKKRHWLLPAAWAHRIGYILLKRRSSVPRFQRSILRLIGSGDRFDYLRSIGLIK